MQDTYINIIPWHLIYFLLDHLTSKIPDKLLIIMQCGYNFNMIVLAPIHNLDDLKSVHTRVLTLGQLVKQSDPELFSPRQILNYDSRPTRTLVLSSEQVLLSCKTPIGMSGLGTGPAPGQGLAQTSRPIYYPALARLHHYYDHSGSRLNMSCVMNAQT